MRKFKLLPLAALVLTALAPQYAAAEKTLGSYAGFSTAADSAIAVDGSCTDSAAGKDLDCLIKEIEKSGSNTYFYRFSSSPNNKHWDNFPGFLTQLKNTAGTEHVKVYTYLAPELWLYPIASQTKDNTENGHCSGYMGAEPLPDSKSGSTKVFHRKFCNGYDIVAWAEAVGALSDTHTNLAGFVVDDYDRVSMNHSIKRTSALCAKEVDDFKVYSPTKEWHCNNPILYTDEYTAKIKAALPSSLEFLVVAYNRPSNVLGDDLSAVYDKFPEALSPTCEVYDIDQPCYDPKSHKAHYDGVVFPVVLEGYNVIDKEPENYGQASWTSWWNSSLIESQLTTLKAKVPGKKVLTMLYATSYNDDRKTEPAYLLEAAQAGYKNSDGVVMYRLQSDYMKAANIDAHKVDEKQTLTSSLFEQLKTIGNQQIDITAITPLTSKPGYKYTYSAPSFVGNSGLDFDQNAFLVAGNYDGSGNEEIAVLNYQYSGNQSITGFGETAGDHTLKPQGSWYSGSAPDFAEVKFALAGDFNNSQKDQLVTISNKTDAAGTQEIHTFALSNNQMNQTRVYDNVAAGFNFDRVKFAVSGKFTSTSRDSIAMLYDYPDPLTTQRIFGFSHDDSSGKLQVKTWLNDTTANISFDNAIAAVAGDFTGDSKDELAILVDKSATEQVIYLYSYNGSQMQRLGSASFTTPAADFPFINVKKVIAGNFDSDEKDELALYYDYGSQYKTFVFDTNGTSQFINTTNSILSPDKVNGEVPTQLVTGDLYGDSNDEMATFHQSN